MDMTFADQQISTIAKLVDSEIQAHHNWIAQAVECGEKKFGGTEQTGFQYAAELLLKLRHLQRIGTDIRRQLSKDGFK